MQTVEQLVGVEALSEWLEHPGTQWLATVIQERADEATKNKAELLIPGDASRTQEIRCVLTGATDELNALYGALNENWEDGQPCPLNYLVPEADYE